MQILPTLPTFSSYPVDIIRNYIDYTDVVFAFIIASLAVAFAIMMGGRSATPPHPATVDQVPTQAYAFDEYGNQYIVDEDVTSSSSDASFVSHPAVVVKKSTSYKTVVVVFVIVFLGVYMLLRLRKSSAVSPSSSTHASCNPFPHHKQQRGGAGREGREGITAGASSIDDIDMVDRDIDTLMHYVRDGNPDF